MYGCESWTLEKAECWRIDAFELWCWRLLRVLGLSRRSTQSILKEISPEYSLEGLMPKLNLPPDLKNWLIGKDPDAEKDWRQEEKGTIKDEMVEWLDGHEFEPAPGVGDGQGSLVCCSPWGCKESDMTEWLNWTELWSEAFNISVQSEIILSVYLLFANTMFRIFVLIFMRSIDWSFIVPCLSG